MFIFNKKSINIIVNKLNEKKNKSLYIEIIDIVNISIYIDKILYNK